MLQVLGELAGKWYPTLLSAIFSPFRKISFGADYGALGMTRFSVYSTQDGDLKVLLGVGCCAFPWDGNYQIHFESESRATIGWFRGRVDESSERVLRRTTAIASYLFGSYPELRTVKADSGISEVTNHPVWNRPPKPTRRRNGVRPKQHRTTKVTSAATQTRPSARGNRTVTRATSRGDTTGHDMSVGRAMYIRTGSAPLLVRVD